jgi:hypothetical protein
MVGGGCKMLEMREMKKFGEIFGQDAVMMKLRGE